ncbi:hypothetical protein [Zymomonas mobilis]|nr:hypothetical protein [Zymomonas mobilis]MDX5947920.1 hypothetical protein [Zymomonas mobilis subsp. pomaceae]
MPPDILSNWENVVGLTRFTSSTTLLARLALAIPLATITGGSTALIMVTLFAYFRHQIESSLKKEDQTEDIYTQTYFEQDYRNQVQSEIELSNIFYEKKESDKRAQSPISQIKEKRINQESLSTSPFYKPKENPEAAVIIDEKSGESLSLSSDTLHKNAQAKNLEVIVFIDKKSEVDGIHLQTKEDISSKSRNNYHDIEGKKEGEHPIDSEKVLSDDVQSSPSSKEITSEEDALLLSSEYIFQKPIQDSPDHVSPDPAFVKLLQSDRDQALYQALHLLNEMRRNVTIVLKKPKNTPIS